MPGIVHLPSNQRRQGCTLTSRILRSRRGRWVSWLLCCKVTSAATKRCIQHHKPRGRYHKPRRGLLNWIGRKGEKKRKAGKPCSHSESLDTSDWQNLQLLGFDACLTPNPWILLSSSPLSLLPSLPPQSTVGENCYPWNILSHSSCPAPPGNLTPLLGPSLALPPGIPGAPRMGLGPSSSSQKGLCL